MSRDDSVAAEAATADAWPSGTEVHEWRAPRDAVALAKIEERRCKVHARMAEFAAIVRQPQRREEALQLLLLIVHWVEGLYSAEDALLAAGAQASAQRQVHRAVLRELHTSVARLGAPDGVYEEFDLVHAIDALLIHEWVVGGRMDAHEPITVRLPANVMPVPRKPQRAARPAIRQPAH